MLSDAQMELFILLTKVQKLYSGGEYQEALEPATEAVELARKKLGENHPDYADCLNNLGLVWHALGDYAAAEELIREAMRVRREVYGEEHPAYAQSLNNLAELIALRGEYASAEPLYRKALETWRASVGDEHPEVATVRNNLANLYRAIGKYAEAVRLHEQALEIWRRHSGDEHPDVAESMVAQALVRVDMGEYAAAEELLSRALRMLRTALGEDHYSAVRVQTFLAAVHHRKGETETADRLYREALEKQRQRLGDQHAHVAETLNNLALLRHELGDFAGAEELYSQALDIDRAKFGERSQSVGTTLNNRALLYHDMGRYSSALPLYEQALEIRRGALGEHHPDVAQTLNNLATLQMAIGDERTAESLHRQALDIRRAALGQGHPDVSQSLNNLALLYHRRGDTDAALPLYLEALDVRREALGPQHPDVAQSLNNLGGLYRQTGRFDLAQRAFAQALDIYRVALGEEHTNVALCLHNLAYVHQGTGEYELAEPLYHQALEVLRKVQGEEYPDTAGMLINLSILYAATGREREALAAQKRAAAVDDCLIGQVFSIGSESQRAALLESLQSHLSSFLSLVSQRFADFPEAVHAALDMVLRRKAIGAEALAAQRDAVLGGQYLELRGQLQELSELRMRIARKTLAGPGPQSQGRHRQMLEDWEAQKDRLEAQLARQIPEMSLERRLKAVDRQAVAQALPADSVLIEFVRSDVIDANAVTARGESHWRPAHYLVFVMAAGQPDAVRMIDLGEADRIDRMIAELRSVITGEVGDGARRDLGESPTGVLRADVREKGASLRAAVYDPLLDALGDGKRLIISPDGDLTRLPFEILPTDGGRNLIDELEISYLSAGRDVLRFGTESGIRPAQAAVIADPDFDLSASVVDEAAVGERVTGRHSRDMDRSLHFERLLGTRTEGESIAGMLGVRPWMGDAALEARLKAYRSPHILHLATHGFFLADQERDQQVELRDLGGLSSPSEGGVARLAASRLENPLLRSGLALAGVNTWLAAGEPPAEAEDGVITAEDVSGLDLLATEMVVLSACETGLGEIRTGEGVFGLRRAFAVAGAKTLIMSLWKVPDQQTQELMEELYRHIIDGRPRAEALRAAQLKIRAKYPDPRDWGAFVCQGDPSPLATTLGAASGSQRAT